MLFNPITEFIKYLRNKKAEDEMKMSNPGFVDMSRFNPFQEASKPAPQVSTVAQAPKNATGSVLGASTTAGSQNIDVMDPNSDIGQHIAEVAARNGLKARLLAAILATESENNPKAYVKATGAKGLGQLTPIAAKDIGVNYNSNDMYDPYKSAEYAALYLNKQLGRYGDQVGNDPLAIYTLYNAGTPGGKLDAGNATAKRLLQKYAEARQKYK